jgi:hypothetical protein
MIRMEVLKLIKDFWTLKELEEEDWEDEANQEIIKSLRE